MALEHKAQCQNVDVTKMTMTGESCCWRVCIFKRGWGPNRPWSRHGYKNHMPGRQSHILEVFQAALYFCIRATRCGEHKHGMRMEENTLMWRKSMGEKHQAWHFGKGGLKGGVMRELKKQLEKRVWKGKYSWQNFLVNSWLKNLFNRVTEKFAKKKIRQKKKKHSEKSKHFVSELLKQDILLSHFKACFLWEHFKHLI